MKTLDLVVIEQAVEWLKQAQPIWLCTVLRTYGSAPRSAGSLLVATADGKYSGSLSGGCIEEDFLQQIATQKFLQPSQTIRYGHGESEYRPNVALPCGGSIDLLVEYIQPNLDNIVMLEAMNKALQGQLTLQKLVTLGEHAKLTQCEHPLSNTIEWLDQQIIINLQSCTTIFIACISAVALYCIEFASALGFNIIVCEDREEELRQITESPLLDKVQLIQSFPSSYLEQHGCTTQTAILSLTHDPRIDDLTMMSALETPAFYIGAMGSKRNSENRLARLRECTDFSDEVLSRIHAPIGLALGSKTPAEIALAIMADIVKIKNKAQ